MKRLFTLIVFCSFSLVSTSQILVHNDFTGYNGLSSTIAPGWFYSWNDTAATSRSYYTSAGSCGISCPAYKFGINGAYVITPSFSNADSLRFYMKGNGSFQPNKFHIYAGPDTMTWTLLRTFDSIPLASQIVTLPIGSAYNYIKFQYQKDSLGYNVGIDDVSIFSGIFTNLNPVRKFTASIFPNPTSGMLNIETGTFQPKSLSVSVSNVLGREVKNLQMNIPSAYYQVNLSDLDAGVYMVHVKSEFGEFTQRIVIRK
ncbi:MAG: T9SS C-terminal target domain-containing protein [Bacteroidetes bacterium]|nr:MAG: T9SS C-terminal target domain-containing protein [Bacteroidota bacterium]REK04720.1 MAG: T9SS C-terminal target domain-containing protein [Bacteroidota bacterium]REK36194.1 MAG: T9SS C-terminal target domain-containing protein [Bacteroidota bacterium]REK51435.1 MAG: T9SS C-terminal target domain-containing protein [Bacteroidota bacterium]